MNDYDKWILFKEQLYPSYEIHYSQDLFSAYVPQ